MSTINTDPPASTPDPDPLSAHRRYNTNGSRARALFRRYLPRFRRSQPNTVEHTELQQRSSQNVIVIPVHEPANVQVPALLNNQVCLASIFL